MAEIYDKAQIDSIASTFGARVKTATDAATLKTNIAALSDTNFMTDAQQTKLAGLEDSRFVGTFLTSAAIPTVGAVAGSFAHVDAGVGQDVELWIYDADDDAFVLSAGTVSGETAASIKTKYESNADTNPFADADKAKLDALTYASGITDAVAALDAALA